MPPSACGLISLPPHTSIYMLFRWLLGIIIIGVAVVMTTLLVRLSYFPEESRLASEEPKLVLERFLSRTSAESVLDIWKGREIVGTLRVMPLGLNPVEKLRLSAQGRLRVEGDLLVAFPGLEGTKVRLVSNMAMANDGSVKESSLTLSTNNFAQTLRIDQMLDAKEPRILVSQGDQVLMDTAANNDGDEQATTMMGLFLRSVGVDPQDLKKRQAEAKKTADNTTTEARRGGFIVAEREFTGYVLTTSLGGADRRFTLYISDSGELVQMKTSFLDYQFISQDLRPDGVTGPMPRTLKDRLPTVPPRTFPPSK